MLYRKVQTIPVITRELKDLRCCDGDAATLECQVEAKPPPDIRWEKAGKVREYNEFTVITIPQTCEP